MIISSGILRIFTLIALKQTYLVAQIISSPNNWFSMYNDLWVLNDWLHSLSTRTWMLINLLIISLICHLHWWCRVVTELLFIDRGFVRLLVWARWWVSICRACRTSWGWSSSSGWHGWWGLEVSWAPSSSSSCAAQRCVSFPISSSYINAYTYSTSQLVRVFF